MSDYVLGDTIYIMFTTRNSSGAPTSLASPYSVAVYEDNSTTEITAGVTLTTDFDSRTGLNHVAIVASGGNGYAAGGFYHLVITGGTVGGTSVVGEVVGSFSIQAAGLAASAISSTTFASGAITAGSIAASALDGKGDWNIGKTGYSLTQTFPTNFADLAITASTGLVTVGTNNDKTGYSISGTKTTLDALNDVSTTQVNTEVDTALSDIGLQYLVNTAVAGANVTDNSIIAKMVSSSATADWDTFVNTTDSLQAIADSGGGGPTAAQIADAVWDEVLDSNHVVANSAAVHLTDILDDTGTSGVIVATNNDKTGYTVSTIGSGVITAASIAASALDGKGDWNIGKTGYALSTGGIDSIWTRTLTESYAADGAQGTATQLLYAMHQYMYDADISGTTWTIRRLNGTTTAAVITLDNATTPTDKNRTA